MLLIGVKEIDGWLHSRWNLTYKAGWESILKACAFSAPYYEQLEILVGDQSVTAQSKEEIMNLGEARNLTFRGISKVIKAPMMITYYNQLNIADAAVAMATDEFAEADYEKFNKSLAQYLNSIEMAMYR